VARYRQAVCRHCRREGTKLFLKGEKCFVKCTLDRKAMPPGMHTQLRRRKVSDYGLQLRAKQKARRLYGLVEKQFRNYFDQAEREPGVTGLNLLRHLELRLDNVIYRMGLGSSRKQARQLVTHRHFEVNGKLVNVPSYPVKPGDAIRVRENNSGVVQVALEAARVRVVPSWISFNPDEMSGRVMALPARDEMESGVEEQLVVEFYSR
jgi:small subunit ribosomal protein S4